MHCQYCALYSETLSSGRCSCWRLLANTCSRWLRWLLLVLGSLWGFAPFLPAQADSCCCVGAICAKASHKHTIEQLWQMRLMGTSYLEQSTRAGQADSCTLPSAQAAPRRLSFSGSHDSPSWDVEGSWQSRTLRGVLQERLQAWGMLQRRTCTFPHLALRQRQRASLHQLPPARRSKSCLLTCF